MTDQTRRRVRDVIARAIFATGRAIFATGSTIHHFGLWLCGVAGWLDSGTDR